jgi:DNA replication initiation complex subunit (GINS family)
MYLILSVAFFLLATLGGNPGSDLTFNVDEKGGANLQLNPGDGEKDAAKDPKPAAEPDAVPDKVATRPPRELTAEEKTLIDTLVKRIPDKDDQVRARVEMETKLASASPEDLTALRKVLKDPCGTDSLKGDIGMLGKDFEPRLRDACRKIMSDTPTFGRALFENIPKMATSTR